MQKLPREFPAGFRAAAVSELSAEPIGMEQVALDESVAEPMEPFGEKRDPRRAGSSVVNRRGDETERT